MNKLYILLSLLINYSIYAAEPRDNNCIKTDSLHHFKRCKQNQANPTSNGPIQHTHESPLTLKSKLLAACCNNEPIEIYNLITRDGANYRLLYEKENTLFHAAAERGADLALIMLDHIATQQNIKIYINQYNAFKETPLSIAIRKKTRESTQAAHTLLDLGADPNKPATTAQWTPLMLASRHNNTELMIALLDKKADGQAKAKNRNALNIAYSYNCPDAADMLLTRKISTGLAHPLYYVLSNPAEYSPNTDVAPMLRIFKKYGIKLDTPIEFNRKKAPALTHLLSGSEQTHLIKALLEFGAEPTEATVCNLFKEAMQDQSNNNALQKLILCLSHTNKIFTLNGNSLLIEAARLKKPVIAAAIAESCPRYHSSISTEGKYALHYLVTSTHALDAVHACIKHMKNYVDILETNYQNTPLMLAQTPDIAAHLIACGANIQAHYIGNFDESLSVLSCHITNPNPEVFKFLLAVDPDLSCEQKNSLRERFAEVYNTFNNIDDNNTATINAINTALDLSAPLIDVLELSSNLIRPNNQPSAYFLQRLGIIFTTLDNFEEAVNNPESSELIRKHINTDFKAVMERQNNPRRYRKMR